MLSLDGQSSWQAETMHNWFFGSHAAAQIIRFGGREE